MEPHRILLTCEDYLPCIGGAEMCVYHVRKELLKLGHHVTVYTNTIETSDDEANITRVPWKSRSAELWKNIRTLWKMIGEHDLVHCQYSFRLACIAGPIARLRGKPMLLTQQGKGIVPEAHSRWIHGFLIKICQHVSMKTASHITATSDEIADLTAAFVPQSKITLVSNGYDARYLSPDPSLAIPAEFVSVPSDTKKLLTVRRLVPKNGIHILLQALTLVLKKRGDFHYFAIGEGRSEPFVRELIQKLSLNNHVTLLGKRENDQLKPYYQHADLLLVPSSAEARSIACIEAMGMGKPLIASRVGGLIDLLGKNSEYGQLVSIYDSEACTYDPPDYLPEERLQPLADAIVSFFENPRVLLEKAAKAATLARRTYAWQSIALQYNDLYSALLHDTRNT